MQNHCCPPDNQPRRAIHYALVVSLAVSVAISPFFAHASASRAGIEQTDANSFVRDILHHEVQAQLQDHALWSYEETKIESGAKKTFSVYQTKQGEIDRLVAVNGRPVSEAQARAEDGRIAKLIHQTREMRVEQRKRTEDGEHARAMLRVFPDAFNFQYDGSPGQLVKLKFVPNPKFHADSHPAQVFHHMEGTMILDAAHKRLIAIDGKLTSEVRFGGGWLGHLDPGGVFNVKQEEVSPGFWEVTVMHVEMKGKALFFRTIGAHEDESYARFNRVPDDASLEQAAASVRRNTSGN